jgi:glycine/D-amino acid oxidase-like deaminating enzyme
MAASDYSALSLWLAHMTLTQRPAVEGMHDYDVAVVGGGYSGLWCAYYLKTLAPELSICLLEAEVCGYGASGRNGGWMMATLEGESRLMAGLSSDLAANLRRQVTGILPEVQRVLERESIDCDYAHGGGIYTAARYPEQARIQRQLLAHFHALGYGEEDFRWLSGEDMSRHLAMRATRGGIYTPHIACVHPAKLVAGLAHAVEQLGVDIFEHSPVKAVRGDVLVTDRASVRAPRRILALEGFGDAIPEHSSRVLSVQSRMLATEPLTDGQWSDIGLHAREVFCDASPLITYGQRTAEGRLVFGSRGSYRFGGRSRSNFSGDVGAFQSVHALLLDCLPQLQGVAITHRWGGSLGVPRAGVPHAVYDPRSGAATLGGYQGEGVGASNLMARTLVDLMLERDTELTTMPWARVGDPSRELRRWEPEPLRWLGYAGTNLALKLEESVYRRQMPAPVRALARGVSQFFSSLR